MQTTCDACGGDLAAGASYCDLCGTRTRRALSTIRLAVRVEILLVVLTVVLIATFAVIFLNQPAGPTP